MTPAKDSPKDAADEAIKAEKAAKAREAAAKIAAAMQAKKGPQEIDVPPIQKPLVGIHLLWSPLALQGLFPTLKVISRRRVLHLALFSRVFFHHSNSLGAYPPICLY